MLNLRNTAYSIFDIESKGHANFHFTAVADMVAEVNFLSKREVTGSGAVAGNARYHCSNSASIQGSRRLQR